MDYDGIMGVPITFMDKYNPTQFEIIGLGIANLGLECGVEPYKPEHKRYRKEVQKRGAVDGDLYFVTNGVVEVPYSRILIRRRQKSQEFREYSMEDLSFGNVAEESPLYETENYQNE